METRRCSSWVPALKTEAAGWGVIVVTGEGVLDLSLASFCSWVSAGALVQSRTLPYFASAFL